MFARPSYLILEAAAYVRSKIKMYPHAIFDIIQTQL